MIASVFIDSSHVTVNAVKLVFSVKVVKPVFIVNAVMPVFHCFQ